MESWNYTEEKRELKIRKFNGEQLKYYKRIKIKLNAIK